MGHVEEIMASVEDYLEARDEYRKCVAGCEVSADYHCWRYRDKYEKASARVAAALQAWLESAIAGRLPLQEQKP